MTAAEPPTMLPGLAEAAAVLRASRLTQYRVRLVSSGFGDMLTVANFLSAVGDLLGLRFCGLVLPPSFSRPYYDDLVDHLGLHAVAAEHRGGPELVIDDTSFATPPRPLAALLAEQIRAHPEADTLLLTMRSIAAAQVVQGLAALLDPDLRRKLQARGVEFSDEQLDGWLDQTEARIRGDGGFDEIVFGEANTQDWVASVRLLLNSAVVASTARSFVANMLTFFAPSCQGQRFYSPLGTGIYADLGCIGLDQRRFSSFAEVVDDLHRDPPQGLAR